MAESCRLQPTSFGSQGSHRAKHLANIFHLTGTHEYSYFVLNLRIGKYTTAYSTYIRYDNKIANATYIHGTRTSVVEGGVSNIDLTRGDSKPA